MSWETYTIIVKIINKNKNATKIYQEEYPSPKYQPICKYFFYQVEPTQKRKKLNSQK